MLGSSRQRQGGVLPDLAFRVTQKQEGHKKVAMQKGRPEAASKRSHSANGKDARDQSPDARKIPDHFSRKLFAFPGAKDALEKVRESALFRSLGVALQCINGQQRARAAKRAIN